jgi:hypothetical protein
MRKKQKEQEVAPVENHEQINASTKRQMLSEYLDAERHMRTYPHHKAWLDAEMVIYESIFGEGEAFCHGFLECYNMMIHFKSMHNDELRDALVTLATSNRGVDLKRSLHIIKALYKEGHFKK